MKKLLLLLISFLIVGAVALQSNVPGNNLVKENAMAIMGPEPDCDEWSGVICHYYINDICGFMIPGSTCYFPNMRHWRHDDPTPTD